jgi:histidinol phosphatase-like PHP family hydrolase/DNA polymerase/3'-5' exonuclease PolX
MTLTNAQISRQLEYIASLLEYLEGPSFPVRRFSEMSRAVELFDFPLSLFSSHRELHKIRVLFFPKVRDEQLDVLRGLMIESVEPADETYARQTGLEYRSRSPLIAALEKEVTPDTVALIQLPDMGAARAAVLRDLLGIHRTEDLIRNCRQHMIRKLDGFDAELEKKWSLGRWHSSDNFSDPFPPMQWAIAEYVVDYILEQLSPLTEQTLDAPLLSPWEEFQRASRAEGTYGRRGAEHFGHREQHPEGRDPFPLEPDRWGAPIRPVANVRLRRSWIERIRDALTKSRKSKFGDRYSGPPGRMPLDRNRFGEIPADASAPRLLEGMEAVGEFRRLDEAVGSLEFLLATRAPEELANRIAEFSFLRVQSRRGNFIKAVIDQKKLVIAEKYDFPGAEVRFYLCAPHSFPASLVRRSCAESHWTELTRRAAAAELFLDETGLYRGKKEVSLLKEGDLYGNLALPYLPAEIRDGLFEFHMPPGAPSLLIRREQIRGDLHLHTTFSDGSGTIEQMADKALANGLEYIAVTDHSKRVAVANGMSEHRVLEYWRTVDAINRQIREMNIPLTILKGVEVDILENGDLDFGNEILAQADWVMASLHYHRSQPREKIHRRIAAAMRCPYVSAISHPTGKEWQSEFRINMDFDYVLDLAKKNNKCLEMNSRLHRLDPDWRLCRRAKEHGVKIVISTDSHAPSEMDYLRYGIQIARKAGLTKDDIINTLPLAELMARCPRPKPEPQKPAS